MFYLNLSSDAGGDFEITLSCASCYLISNSNVRSFRIGLTSFSMFGYGSVKLNLDAELDLGISYHVDGKVLEHDFPLYGLPSFSVAGITVALGFYITTYISYELELQALGVLTMGFDVVVDWNITCNSDADQWGVLVDPKYQSHEPTFSVSGGKKFIH